MHIKYIDAGKMDYTDILELCIRHVLQSSKQCKNLLFHSVISSTPEDELLSRECMYLISHLSNDFLLNTGKERGNATGQTS